MSFSHTYIQTNIHTYMLMHTQISTYVHIHLQMSNLHLVILQDSTCLVCFTGNYSSPSTFYAVFMTTYSRETLV